jgi:hypothetical protein
LMHCLMRHSSTLILAIQLKQATALEFLGRVTADKDLRIKGTSF